jgi:hypothetical protein
MAGPFVSVHHPEISLSPAALPGYALRTTLRMFGRLARFVDLTFTYATLAAKSRRAEPVRIALLDEMQSVPILAYLSFTVLFFVSLFPGRMLGPERLRGRTFAFELAAKRLSPANHGSIPGMTLAGYNRSEPPPTGCHINARAKFVALCNSNCAFEKGLICIGRVKSRAAAKGLEHLADAG